MRLDTRRTGSKTRSRQAQPPGRSSRALGRLTPSGNVTRYCRVAADGPSATPCERGRRVLRSEKIRAARLRGWEPHPQREHTLRRSRRVSPRRLSCSGLQALLAFGSPRRAEDRRGLCQRMACRIRQPCFPFAPRMHHAACVATHLHGNIRQVLQFRNFKFHAGKHRTRRMRALDHQQRHKTCSARCFTFSPIVNAARKAGFRGEGVGLCQSSQGGGS